MCTLVRHNSLARGQLLGSNSVVRMPHGSARGMFIVNRMGSPRLLGVSHSNVDLARTLDDINNVGRLSTSTAKIFIVHSSDRRRGTADVTSVCRLGVGSTSTLVVNARFSLGPCSVICIATTPVAH